MNFRRRFLILSTVGLAALAAALFAVPRRYLKWLVLEVERLITTSTKVGDETRSDIFVAKNGTPQENVAKVMAMLGGIERFIKIEDIVILKPNGQWWNQGRTNLAAMKGFIDLVLAIPDFKGEIIIAENHHFMDDSLPEGEKDNVRGWVEFGEINNEIDGVKHNLNSLVELYRAKGYANVTKCHWRDGGTKRERWGNGQSGGIVRSPAEGDGYVWSDIDFTFTGYLGFKKWPVKMTYPVFTSSFSGITIDFKNGAFRRDGCGGGSYLPDRPIRFINFPALNSHGWDTGITSAIKNYMGVTDLSCGYWGYQPRGYFNVHDCGGEEHYPYAKAGPLGYFMKTIRKADLNIVTAEWVGWGDRIDVSKAVRARTVLAGVDPVALDYYSAKYLVYPHSGQKNLHDPDHSRSRIRRFLELTQACLGEGALNEYSLKVSLYDFNTGGRTKPV